MSHVGHDTLANGVHAKQPLLDLVEELTVEDAFKKMRPSNNNKL